MNTKSIKNSKQINPLHLSTINNIHSKTTTKTNSTASNNKKNRCSSACGTWRLKDSKYEEMFTLVKDTKDYNEKVEKLKNRIVHLKKEEDSYIQKMEKMKRKEMLDEKIQKEKMKRKQELYKAKIEAKKEIMQKRKQTEQIKKETKEKLQKSYIETIQNKKNKYQLALNDKIILKTIINQYNTSYTNRNNYCREKVRYQRNKFETKLAHERIQSQNLSSQRYTQKLEQQKELNKSIHRTFNHLEILEKKCIENLKKTMTQSTNMMMKSKIALKTPRIRGLNRSLGDENIEKYKQNFLNKDIHKVPNGINVNLNPNLKCPLTERKSKKKIYIRNRVSSKNTFDTKFHFQTID